MADLVLSDSLSLSDSLQVGRGNRVSDQITLSDSVIVELGPILNTQLPVEVNVGSKSNAIASQVPVEVILPTAGLIQLALTDTMTLSDSVRVGRGLVIAETLTMTDSASVVMSAPLTETLSDTLTLSDSFSSRLLVRLTETLSDSMNTLADSVSVLLSIPMRQMTQLAVEVDVASKSQVRMSQTPLEVIVPTNGFMQLVLSDTMTLTDSVSKNLSSGITLQLSDTMSMSDGFSSGFVISLTLSDSFSGMTDSIQTRVAVQLQLSLSDQLVLSDSVQTSIASQTTLGLSDSLSLSDSITTQLNTIVFLTLSVSDSMDFWGDDFTYLLPFHPRDVPTGDPTDNCCPPNIFVTS